MKNGQFWRVLDGLGQCWTVLDGLEKSRMVLDGLGRSWTVLDGFGWSTKVFTVKNYIHGLQGFWSMLRRFVSPHIAGYIKVGVSYT